WNEYQLPSGPRVCHVGIVRQLIAQRALRMVEAFMALGLSRSPRGFAPLSRSSFARRIQLRDLCRLLEGTCASFQLPNWEHTRVLAPLSVGLVLAGRVQGP